MAQKAANGTLRSGGQLLMDCLFALGAQKGFGVPGESYLAVLDAMYDHRADFDFIMTRQEGGAAYMAAAWGKLTGAPGLCFVTRGPGATNASIGVHTAMQDSLPRAASCRMSTASSRDGRESGGRSGRRRASVLRWFAPAPRLFLRRRPLGFLCFASVAFLPVVFTVPIKTAVRASQR